MYEGQLEGRVHAETWKPKATMCWGVGAVLWDCKPGGCKCVKQAGTCPTWGIPNATVSLFCKVGRFSKKNKLTTKPGYSVKYEFHVNNE